MLWLLGGILVGFINAVLTVRTVTKVRPEVNYSMSAVVLRGLFSRLGLAAAIMLVAINRGIGAGLMAFAGLWLARWFFVRWVQRGYVPWVWFDV